MTRLKMHRRSFGSIAAVALALAAPAARMHAQEAPETSDLLRAAPTISDKCNGPLGDLIPECKAGKTAINISTQNTQGESALGRGLRIPSAKEPRERELQQNQALRPEPYTEFQSFTASTTGKVLPIFGASLFDGVPTTFAPLDRVPVTADYAIGPGDEILLRTWGQVNLDVALTVDRGGAVFVPQAGNINVAGIEFRDLSGYLRAQLGRVFRNFDLNVSMGQLRSIQIFVVGQARRPGVFTVSSLSTVVNALFASGGPSATGSMRRIQLRRGVEIQTEFDLYDLLLRGDKSKDARLLPGDVVYIPPAGPQVAVIGSVKSAAIYELKSDSSVADVIQMAGGVSAVADGQHVTLERIRGQAREVVELRLDAEGLANRIGDGDVISVPSIVPRFANAVTLRGSVANPGRFSWHAGMRVRDIIPDKESLLTRDYWHKRNVLGDSGREKRRVEPPVVEERRKPDEASLDFSEVPEINWSYALIERQNARDLKAELIPFNLGKLVLEGDESQNLELRPADVVTVFSQKDIRVAASQQTRRVRLEGEFAAAGIYDVRSGETLGELVGRAGGLTKEAYLYGAEFLRESTRMDQQRRLDQFVDELERQFEQTATKDLARSMTQEDAATTALNLQNSRQFITRMRNLKATGRIVLHLEADSADIKKLMSLRLEDGDRFRVPPRPATVNVLGAVYNQNAFIHEADLRVSDYLRLAGGPTRTADKRRAFIIRADGSVVPRQGSGLFGSSFESARLNAGDSIVVPEVIFKPGMLRGLRDWTQVFSQMALGAAAINVLR